MKRQRILVTGATGFTGSHLCERLTSEGYSVRGLVRDPSRCSPLHQWGVETVTGDLCDPNSLRQATKGIDVVYHIAALFRQENVSRKEMWEVNVQGTKNILEAAIRSEVQKFVHCSTVGVHGDIKKPPANEDSPYGPGDRYQESKTEGERVVLRAMAEGRLPVVVFRPGGIYGPRDLRFLKLFKTIKNRSFVMLGSGQVIYQMVYIDDLIDGIVLCGTNERATGNVYILTGCEPITLNQLVCAIAAVLGVAAPRLRFPVTPVYVAGFICELVCKPLGIPPPLYRRRVDFFQKTRSFDISKAKRELGFYPKTELSRGIKLTAEWYREGGYL
jgi:nucleoside-diphosphate-sugar epimerase